MKRAWLAVGLLLSSCVPWTVRPIEKSDESASSTRVFDATAYVDSIWESKVLPAAAAAPGSLSNTAPAFLIKGSGRAVKVDRASRIGLLLIDLPPFDGRADAAIEIGPVLRGTALRDALPFIQFSQFVNQLEFARVGNALNDRLLHALAALPQDIPPGATVEFAGAASRTTPDALPEIVPVRLTIQAGAK